MEGHPPPPRLCPRLRSFRRNSSGTLPSPPPGAFRVITCGLQLLTRIRVRWPPRPFTRAPESDCHPVLCVKPSTVRRWGRARTGNSATLAGSGDALRGTSHQHGPFPLPCPLPHTEQSPPWSGPQALPPPSLKYPFSSGCWAVKLTWRSPLL